jgi:DNA replication protein DnaC
MRERLLRFANLPHPDKPRTFGGFEPVVGTEDAVHSSKQFANEDCDYHMLVLIGPVGCGKSHLLEAIGRRILERGKVIKYEYAPELLDKIRDSYRHNADMCIPYETAETLLLDDLGVERATPWVVERLSVIIDGRYRTGKRIALATNLTFEEIKARDYDDQGRKMTDGWERIASRLYDEGSGDVKHVTMDCEDYRGRR